jgi:uncharacterized repeat protein (TIGR02059 family)
MNIMAKVSIFLATALVATIAVTADTTSSSVAHAHAGTWTSHGVALDGVAGGVAAGFWTSVTYGNDVFVAVAADNGGRVMTSPDALIWTTRTAPPGAWQSVTFGNGSFVAIAADSAITSTDGITWTAHAVPVSAWASVTYGNGLYVAVAGGSGYVDCQATTKVLAPWVMTSEDGSTWATQSAATSELQPWNEVTFGNDRFVAVANVGPRAQNCAAGDGPAATHRVMTSTNGKNWVSVTESAAPFSAWTSVAYGLGSDNVGRFVAVSYAGERIITSVDGTEWDLLDDSASRTVASGDWFHKLTYGGGKFVAVAFSGKKVMTSTDGRIWTSSDPGTTQANVWSSVAYGDGVYVAVADSGTERVRRLGPTVPAKPTTSGLSCTNANVSLDVSLTTDGGSPVTNYEYHIATSHPSAEPTTWQPFSPSQSASPLQWNMKDLGFAPQVQHFFYVRAVNAVGASSSSWISGSSSSCASSFTVTAPAAPTGLTAILGPEVATISFTAGSANGSAITNYEYSLDGVTYLPLNPADASSPVTIPGLIGGQNYTIYLKAVNSVGASVPSEPLTLTALGPAPTVTAASPDQGSTIGGTAITISGSGFTTGATVLIDGVACTDVVVVSPTSLTCVTPPGTAGARDVTVTNADGQSATISGGFTYVTAPVTPGVPDLSVNSDSGTSSSDDITSDSTPTISVAGATNNHTVTVTASRTGFDDVSCTFVATAASTCDLGFLADGVWSVVSSQQTSSGITSAFSAPLLVTIDTAPPTVVSFSTSQVDGSYTVGAQITVSATISEPLADGASITVTLDSGATVVLTKTSATELSGVYTVAAGQSSNDLTVTSYAWTTAPSDVAGNVMTTATMPTGVNNIAGAHGIVIDTAPPTVVSTVMNAAGTDMTITFNEALGNVPPSSSDVVVTVNGVPVAVSAISISGSTVVVTLATPAAAGQLVVLAYAAPAPDTSAFNAALQDRAGNDAEGFTSGAVVPTPASQGAGLVVGSPEPEAPAAEIPPQAPAPLPVPTVGGEFPRLQPGVGQAFENGEPIEITISVVDQTRLALSGPNFRLVLSGDCSGSDCLIQVDENGRETLVLELDGKAKVSGFGFLPGTLVHVWIFSDPVYLGALLVAEDGTFDGDLQLLGVPAGEHTLQVNGISFDGAERTADLGVLISSPSEQLPATEADSPELLPFTGADPWKFLTLGLLLALLGSLLMSVRGRESWSM